MSPEIQPSTQVNEPEEVQDIQLVRGIRRKIVASLTEKNLPSDPEQMDVLLKVMNDMDRQAIGRLKIKADINKSNKENETRQVIAGLLKQISPASIAQAGATAIDVVSREIPSLPAEVKTRDYVEGEADVGISSETYDVFMQRTAHIEVETDDEE